MTRFEKNVCIEHFLRSFWISIIWDPNCVCAYFCLFASSISYPEWSHDIARETSLEKIVKHKVSAVKFANYYGFMITSIWQPQKKDIIAFISMPKALHESQYFKNAKLRGCFYFLHLYFAKILLFCNRVGGGDSTKISQALN